MTSKKINYNPCEECACGQPLHYVNKELERWVRELVEEAGPWIWIHLKRVAYRVPRHYIALHGVKASELESLGFQRVLKKDAHGRA